MPVLPSALLFSDLDETFLDHGETVPALLSACRSAAGHVQVVFASSRTAQEIRVVQEACGWENADFIAEDGSITGVNSVALASALGAFESVDIAGSRYQLVRHGWSIAQLIPRVREAAHLAGVPFDPGQLSVNAFRENSLLIPVALEGADLLADALASAGLDIGVGTRWLSVAQGGGKGRAVHRYLNARRVIGGLPPIIAAVGDAGNDESMLRAVPRAFVMRHADGTYHSALAALPGATLLDAPGCLGWLEALHAVCPVAVEAS